MPRRPSTVATLTCDLSPRERMAIDDLKAMLSIRSDANLMRVVLWQYLHWQQLQLDGAIFAERGTKPTAAQRTRRRWDRAPYFTAEISDQAKTRTRRARA